MASEEIIREVYKVLEERRDNPIDSYTSKIMQDSDKKAEDKILEKVAEECGEVLLAIIKVRFGVYPLALKIRFTR